MASMRALGQGVVEGGEDQRAVAGDGLGEGDEFGDVGAPGPGDPPGQQRPALGRPGGLMAALLLGCSRSCGTPCSR